MSRRSFIPDDDRYEYPRKLEDHIKRHNLIKAKDIEVARDWFIFQELHKFTDLLVEAEHKKDEKKAAYYQDCCEELAELIRNGR